MMFNAYDYKNEGNLKDVINTLNYVLKFSNGVLEEKEKKNFIKIYEYLSKYLYVVDKTESYESAERKPDEKIWQCWLQGKENMPALVKVCTESIKKYNPAREVVLITEKNFSDYIDVPDYIIQKYNKGVIIPAHFSDIIRLLFLEKYGGVWIDSTILLTGQLPEAVFDSEFFTYKNPVGECFRYINTLKELEIMCNFLNQCIMLPSTWFISSCPHNIIVSNWLKLLIEYWKHENAAVDYFIMDYFFVLLLLKNKICRRLFTDMPVYLTTPVEILQSAMPEKYDKEGYEVIKSISPIHKLTLNYTPDDRIKDRLYHRIICGNMK